MYWRETDVQSREGCTDERRVYCREDWCTDERLMYRREIDEQTREWCKNERLTCRRETDVQTKNWCMDQCMKSCLHPVISCVQNSSWFMHSICTFEGRNVACIRMCCLNASILSFMLTGEGRSQIFFKAFHAFFETCSLFANCIYPFRIWKNDANAACGWTDLPCTNTYIGQYHWYATNASFWVVPILCAKYVMFVPKRILPAGQVALSTFILSRYLVL